MTEDKSAGTPGTPEATASAGRFFHERVTAPMSEPGEPTGSRCRWILGPPPEAWSDFVLSEWELERTGWSDLHPHDEINIVVEGELHVECEGETVVVGPRETVRVPAGKVGRYSAPVYARMIAVYGPNPTGAPTEFGEYWEVPADSSADNAISD
jgi:mannose-6-phosphate isomerase-like protein (cupin superfamily)